MYVDLVVFANTDQLSNTKYMHACAFQYKYTKVMYSYTNTYLDPTLVLTVWYMIHVSCDDSFRYSVMCTVDTQWSALGYCDV